MSIKEFLKSLSIYGVLPVFTKFASFLLVPIYVRVFSSAEFGIVELIASSVNFVIYAMNLEFYGAVGRFFFERDDLQGKRNLVSSGLMMTIVASIVVFVVGMSMRQQIGDVLFRSQQYSSEIAVGLVWAVFAAISTYLSVLPRYLKKAKLYVAYNAISLLTKLVSTIVFVVVFKLGVMGAVLGNLTGAITSTILYTSVSSLYLRPNFTKSDFFEIVRFSLPLAPGILALGIYQPVMRAVLSRVYSLSDLGLFSFALKMVSIMVIVESSIKLSWKPMLYENLHKANFGNEYFRISKFVGRVLLGTGVIVAVFTPEFVRLIGTAEYYDSAKLVGLLLMGNIVQSLSMLRGFGFEVTKKTHWLSWISMFSSIIGVLFLYFIAPSLGFIGIGVAFMLPSVLAYIIKFSYTNKVIKSKNKYCVEFAFWALLVVASLLILLGASLMLRSAILVILLLIVKPWDYVHRLNAIMRHRKA
ncbi:MAG TPA: hypothetical protein DHW79_02710 [Candidatus Cloacimonas sp.]|jgi:O-antigen/teichoic acid export membrane protein|nr:hypothetical protein [Candidatus Cloacimonas sp.]